MGSIGKSAEGTKSLETLRQELAGSPIGADENIEILLDEYKAGKPGQKGMMPVRLKFTIHDEGNAPKQLTVRLLIECHDPSKLNTGKRFAELVKIAKHAKAVHNVAREALMSPETLVYKADGGVDLESMSQRKRLENMFQKGRKYELNTTKRFLCFGTKGLQVSVLEKSDRYQDTYRTVSYQRGAYFQGDTRALMLSKATAEMCNQIAGRSLGVVAETVIEDIENPNIISAPRMHSKYRDSDRVVGYSQIVKEVESRLNTAIEKQDKSHEERISTYDEAASDSPSLKSSLATIFKEKAEANFETGKHQLVEKKAKLSIAFSQFLDAYRQRKLQSQRAGRSEEFKTEETTKLKETIQNLVESIGYSYLDTDSTEGNEFTFLPIKGTFSSLGDKNTKLKQELAKLAGAEISDIESWYETGKEARDRFETELTAPQEQLDRLFLSPDSLSNEERARLGEALDLTIDALDETAKVPSGKIGELQELAKRISVRLVDRYKPSQGLSLSTQEGLRTDLLSFFASIAQMEETVTTTSPKEILQKALLSKGFAAGKSATLLFDHAQNILADPAGSTLVPGGEDSADLSSEREITVDEIKQTATDLTVKETNDLLKTLNEIKKILTERFTDDEGKDHVADPKLLKELQTSFEKVKQLFVDNEDMPKALTSNDAKKIRDGLYDFMWAAKSTMRSLDNSHKPGEVSPIVEQLRGFLRDKNGASSDGAPSFLHSLKNSILTEIDYRAPEEIDAPLITKNASDLDACERNALRNYLDGLEKLFPKSEFKDKMKKALSKLEGLLFTNKQLRKFEDGDNARVKIQIDAFISAVVQDLINLAPKDDTQTPQNSKYREILGYLTKKIPDSQGNPDKLSTAIQKIVHDAIMSK